MNRNVLLLAGIFLFSAAQLGALGNRIYGMETTLAHGERFLFRAAPVDPYDPFRGRYLSIAVEPRTMEVPEEEASPEYGEMRWVALSVDADGFARFSGFTDESAPGPKIRAKIHPVYPKVTPARVAVEPPFSRFYVNEKLAPEADAAFQAAVQGGKKAAHLAVRIKDGEGVIEELYIEGKPILEYLEEARAAK
jgi:hypothetical protein